MSEELPGPYWIAGLLALLCAGAALFGTVIKLDSVPPLHAHAIAMAAMHVCVTCYGREPGDWRKNTSARFVLGVGWALLAVRASLAAFAIGRL